jgi:succinate dehydrogenase hydrophobic anchor subunit
MANLCSWLFLLAAPFAVCFASLLDGETHIWLGDLRFAFWCVFACVCFVLLICHAT